MSTSSSETTSKTPPKITLITPCHNGEEYLIPYLKGLLSQTYSHVELLFVDDGSTDRTKEVIHAFAKKIIEKGWGAKYVEKEKDGLASAINAALPHIQSEYFTCIGVSDVLHSDFLEKTFAFLESHSDYACVYTKTQIINENNHEQTTVGDFSQQGSLFESFITEKNMPVVPFYLMRTSAFFDSHANKQLFDMDTDLNYQILLPVLYKHKCGFINEVLSTHTISKDTYMSSDNFKGFNQREMLLQTLLIIPMPANERKYFRNVVKKTYPSQEIQLLDSVFKDNQLKEVPDYLADAYKSLLYSITSSFSYSVEYRFFTTRYKELEENIASLSDEDSKKQFRKELGRLSLIPIIGAEKSASLHGNMSPEYFSECKKAAAVGGYPLYKLSSTEVPSYNDALLTHIAPTFVIKQYIYKDIFKPESHDIVIDGGGFVGDTALWFLQEGVKQVFCFEPTESYYNLIFENIPSDAIKEKKVVPVALGLSDKKETLTFSENGAASRVDAKGSIKIECTSIDEFCKENNVIPTLIKLDIEGSEFKALVGARETIKKYKPKVAVSLYHRPEDMVNLLPYLKNLVPEYKFYCKANHPCWEFVLYAIV